MISKILVALDQKGMSQGELESRAGLPPNRISKWKSGTGEPTASQAGSIARALDLPVEYLIYDDIETAAPGRSDEMDRLLWLVDEIGVQEALQRLMLAPGVVHHSPTYAELRERKKPPRDKKSSGGRSA